MGSRGELGGIHGEEREDHRDERERVDQEAGADACNGDHQTGDGRALSRAPLKLVELRPTAFGRSSGGTISEANTAGWVVDRGHDALEEGQHVDVPQLGDVEHDEQGEGGGVEGEHLGPDEDDALGEPVGDRAAPSRTAPSGGTAGR